MDIKKGDPMKISAITFSASANPKKTQIKKEPAKADIYDLQPTTTNKISNAKKDEFLKRPQKFSVKNPKKENK